MISEKDEQNFSFPTTGHKLVLAEKPSVAQSIAKVLGAAKREDGCLCSPREPSSRNAE